MCGMPCTDLATRQPITGCAFCQINGPMSMHVRMQLIHTARRTRQTLNINKSSGKPDMHASWCCRFARARCCPLCRTEAYQKRQVHDGKEAHKHRCATRMQAAVRGYLARKWSAITLFRVCRVDTGHIQWMPLLLTARLACNTHFSCIAFVQYRPSAQLVGPLVLQPSIIFLFHHQPFHALLRPTSLA